MAVLRPRTFVALFSGIIVTTVLYTYQMNILMPHRLNLPSTWINAHQTMSGDYQVCDNLLSNITNGEWIRETEFVAKETEEYLKMSALSDLYDRHLEQVRHNKGIHYQLWREDGKCGFRNIQTLPEDSDWPVTGSWCQAKSEKPCCSDSEDGICGSTCDCSSCIDMRKYRHAEISRWVPRDDRCVWKYYTSVTACQVIKGFREIHFVGDSMIRKFVRAFILLLRNDFDNGASAKAYDHATTKLCTSMDQFYYRPCTLKSGTFASIFKDQRPVCGMNLDRFTFTAVLGDSRASEFTNMVKSLVGKEGTVILLGVGVHLNCKFGVSKNLFMDPIIYHIKQYYSNNTSSTKWPHIIFFPPDTSSILKPLRTRILNGNAICEKYTRLMTQYFEKHGVPVINFRNLTNNVHSYDGTHYGMGVNVMKVQILLNYLEHFKKMTYDK